MPGGPRQQMMNGLQSVVGQQQQMHGVGGPSMALVGGSQGPSGSTVQQQGGPSQSGGTSIRLTRTGNSGTTGVHMSPHGQPIGGVPPNASVMMSQNVNGGMMSRMVREFKVS